MTQSNQTTQPIEVGQVAPAISLPDQHGNIHNLSDYLGKWVLVYFYPQDDTPGCTIEACSLRDASPDFSKLNAQVIGISADDVASHKQFYDKYELNFILLADVDHVVCEAYGAWGKKNIFGMMKGGVRRVSVLVDPAGKVAKVYPAVDPVSHAEEVLVDIAALSQQ